MHITVVVCCYNSANRIELVLKHLSKQKIENLNCEIILVDNNCSDNTVEVALAEWTLLGSPFPLIIVKEIIPGLSNARKKGIFSANGEIIVFCDDDNWLNQDYFQIAYDIMSANLSIGVLAGESRATANIEIPTWFYSYYSNFACGVLDINSGDVSSRLWVWGAGMVLRKSVLINLYARFKHYSNGRTEESLESGEDVEICYWHILADKLLWYDDRLKLKHYMPNKRLDIEIAKKQFDAQLQSAKKLEKITKLVSNYYNFKSGNMTIKIIIMNLFKLKLRLFLNDFYYIISFSLKK
jgi:glycosyltransferase involved in cell wall biosynthesis